MKTTGLLNKVSVMAVKNDLVLKYEFRLKLFH